MSRCPAACTTWARAKSSALTLRKLTMKPVPFDTLKYVEATVALGIPEDRARASCAALLRELAGDAPETSAVEHREARPLPLIHDKQQRLAASAVGEPLEPEAPEQALPTQESLMSASLELEPPEVGSVNEASPGQEPPNAGTQGEFLPSDSLGGTVRNLGKNSRIPPVDDARLTINISRGHHSTLKLAALQQRTTIGEMVERWIDNEIKCWNVAKYGKFHLNP